MHSAEAIILLLTYNNEGTVRKSLDDLLSQSYQNYDLYVFDDCSTDLTFEICQEYASKSKNIHLIRHPENLGVCGNLEYALIYLQNSLKESRYFLWACPDDEWDKLYLEACIKGLLENPTYVASQTNVKVINHQNNTHFVNKYKSIPLNAPWKKISQIFDHLDSQGNPLHHNQIIHSVIRSEYVNEIFPLKDKLFIDVLRCELFIVGLMVVYGGISIHPNPLTTKNIYGRFEDLNPKDAFSINLFSKVTALKSLYKLTIFLKSQILRSKKNFMYVYVLSVWFYLFRDYYYNMKIFIYEKILKKLKNIRNMQNEKGL